jgi:arylamine N-acetyltransferase
VTSQQSTDHISPAWVRRYLKLLGVEPKPPSRAALSELLRANFQVATFENVTSLRRRLAHPNQPVPPLDFDALLANWEARRGGGVCYEIAGMFHRLLVGLGYDATLVLAQITFPGGHQAIQVSLDGQRYLVDPGNGAPLFDLLPLNGETVVRRAGLAYRFRAGEEPNLWYQERWVNEEWAPFCRYAARPPDEDERRTGYQLHHTFGESWVVDRLRLIRCTEDTVYGIAGNELTTFRPSGKEVRTLTSLPELQETAADLFNLPNLPLAETFEVRPNFLALR